MGGGFKSRPSRKSRTARRLCSNRKMKLVGGVFFAFVTLTFGQSEIDEVREGEWMIRLFKDE